MKRVFVDTVYHLALINPRDQYAADAIRFTADFSGAFVTSAWVLAEVANSLTRGNDRALLLKLYRSLAADRRVMIVPPNPELFDEGIHLFAGRSDKEWSFTDCISFIIMREYDLTDALAGQVRTG